MMLPGLSTIATMSVWSPSSAPNLPAVSSVGPGIHHHVAGMSFTLEILTPAEMRGDEDELHVLSAAPRPLKSRQLLNSQEFR